jgi:hypothetical protein
LVCTSFAIHFDAGKKKKNRRKCRVTPQLPTPDRVCRLRGGGKKAGLLLFSFIPKRKKSGLWRR